MAREQPPWAALLIGGPSGVGKSTAARDIALRFGVSCKPRRNMLDRSAPYLWPKKKPTGWAIRLPAHQTQGAIVRLSRIYSAMTMTLKRQG